MCATPPFELEPQLLSTTAVIMELRQKEPRRVHVDPDDEGRRASARTGREGHTSPRAHGVPLELHPPHPPRSSPRLQLGAGVLTESFSTTGPAGLTLQCV
ncbi:hypothetical protein GN956_G22807 [Arapaima gigas]